jgi:CheY-like chemotaxis protein
MTQPPRVLVVEDELLVCDMTVHEMTLASFEVPEAAIADDALALLPKEVRIDPLFTDIRLPGIDGVQRAK